MSSLESFHPAVARWFESELGRPSAPQRDGWPHIQRGEHTLIAAPTGSGKTLAAFLCAIDALVQEGLAVGTLPDETRVLYISPLKALGNDVEKNLQEPLVGVQRELAALGAPPMAIRTFVRSGDTSASARSELRKRPPHILVTTPESLYVLLTSESGRRALASVRTVIVDEIHALVGDRRGAHLALSLERLDALAGRHVQRIGLSATQSPIEEVARFLVGAQEQPCAIVDHGHRRELNVQIELPGSPLEAVMSHEVWHEVFERMAQLILAQRTTLVFVNTRRMAERVTKQLADRLGAEHVAAHHGSLSREHRLQAEQKLKAGQLRALVATASLELGIDIGSVDLVLQLGVTRSIASFLQRVGRSGHRAGAVSEGRIFPLSRDELVDAVALLQAVERGELDRVQVAPATLDILSQQIVACVATQEWHEDELYALATRAYPYRGLPRADFDAVLRMLSEGFATPRGRRGALLHHDRVNGRLRPHKSARLTAMTCGGAIPDNADYAVVLSPSNLTVGSVNEDFAIESMAGDVFQLGNSSWRILRVERSIVRVEDARGTPPSIPFWLGEAPGRSHALSVGVSALRKRLDAALEQGVDAAKLSLRAPQLSAAAIDQLVDYLGAAKAALGVLPTQDTLVAERFFDEAGGMQLVIHAPFGSRLNRAFGLALRKRFCRAFNFELQAAATEDAIVLSLGPTHSFPLPEIAEFLHARSVRQVLVQALLDAPMFETRFRWNATRSLAVRRWEAGRKTPAPLLRMRSADLLALVFPDQQACLENISGDREVPDHPLVRQTIEDCLHEAMDIDALEALLTRLERGDARFVFRELTEPSPLAAEVLGARPYAFLDDAPLEERRTQAVLSRRFMDVKRAQDLGSLDPEAIERVRAEAWPSTGSADEVNDALVTLGCMTEAEAQAIPREYLDALAQDRRATCVSVPGGGQLWCAAERLPQLQALHPLATLAPRISAPARDVAVAPTEEQALLDLVQARIDALGPCTARRLASELYVAPAAVHAALCTLEARGHLLRGRFSRAAEEDEFCERGLLARIHRLTVDRLRREIEPVSPQVFMRFLCGYQRVLRSEQARGPQGLLEVLTQLSGFAAKAPTWESDLLPLRVRDYDPAWLDELCWSGQLRWARLSPSAQETLRGLALRSTPISLATAASLPAFHACTAATEAAPSVHAQRVLEQLVLHGAAFQSDLQAGTGLLPSVLDAALAELVALGLITSDGFAGLRALLAPARNQGHPRHPSRRGQRERGKLGTASAGRWSRLGPATLAKDAAVESVARTLLTRYGVVFRKLLEREAAPAWGELLRVYRRLEARGEIRGGRFVEGFSGEHFALPEAVAQLRRARKEPDLTLVALCASDPLNLLGIVLPGERVVAQPGSRIVLQDGVVVAVRQAGQTELMTELAPELAAQVRSLLVRPERNRGVQPEAGHAGAGVSV
ncbi:MAG TPA: DEAD/DEAH box helicase [Polyangiales bacterium]